MEDELTLEKFEETLANSFLDASVLDFDLQRPNPETDLRPFPDGSKYSLMALLISKRIVDAAQSGKINLSTLGTRKFALKDGKITIDFANELFCDPTTTRSKTSPTRDEMDVDKDTEAYHDAWFPLEVRLVLDELACTAEPTPSH